MNCGSTDAPICRSTTWRRWLNPIIAGWIQYYGRFHRTVRSPPEARQHLPEALGREESTDDYGPTNASGGGGPDSTKKPGLFAHWRIAAPTAGEKSPVTRECHAGIRGSRGLRCPRRPDSRRSGTRFGKPVSPRLHRRATSPGMRAYRLRNGDCGNGPPLIAGLLRGSGALLRSLRAASSSPASTATSGEPGRRS